MQEPSFFCPRLFLREVKEHPHRKEGSIARSRSGFPASVNWLSMGSAILSMDSVGKEETCQKREETDLASKQLFPAKKLA